VLGGIVLDPALDPVTAYAAVRAVAPEANGNDILHAIDNAT
jgi:predicted protein tyrosine phosphatase